MNLETRMQNPNSKRDKKIVEEVYKLNESRIKAYLHCKYNSK